MPFQKRIKREQKTIFCMIKVFCNKHHKTKNALCEKCQELYNYAEKRIAKCPLRKNKPVCADCTIKCYSAEYKEKIKKIMRYSGPRILLHNPYFAIMHIVDKIVSKRKNKKYRRNV